MLGAPVDFAETLPNDWIERLLVLQAPNPAAPLVSLLQDLLREQGERAIGLQRVQEMALWLTKRQADDERPLFAWLNPLTDQLVAAAGGTWPIEIAVEERRPTLPHKPLLNIADDFDAIVAELAVLNTLARRSARPVPGQRASGDFDWTVEREGTQLPVEVKQKASVGMMGHRLEWFWKGVSLLPRGAFIRNYSWHWHVKDVVRAVEARQMIEALWVGAEELRDELPGALEPSRSPCRWGHPEVSLADGRLRMRPAADAPSQANVAIELSTNQTIVLDIRSNPDPQILVCTGMNGGWLKSKLGDKERNDLDNVLRRLNVERQGQLRAKDGLYVVAWWVPMDWEPALDGAWLEGVCCALASGHGPRYLAIWPIGHFEARLAPWALSAAARRDLPWLVND